MTNFLSVKDWDKFQHYRDRNPPWIKLHTSLLEDYDFATLPGVAKGQLLLMWLLAARTDNKIPNDRVWIAHSLRIPAKSLEIEMLVDGGWLIVQGEPGKGRENWTTRYISKEIRELVWKRDGGRCQECGSTEALEYDHKVPVSRDGTGEAENIQLLCRKCNRKKRNRLPSAEQPATQLRKTETETETETDGAFDLFWKAYPRRAGSNPKAAALKAWSASKIPHDVLLEGATRYAAFCEATNKTGTEYVKQAVSWLSLRFEGWAQDWTPPEKQTTWVDDEIGKLSVG